MTSNQYKMEKVVDLAGGHPGPTSLLGWTYAEAGKRDQALETLNGLQARYDQDPFPASYFVWIYAGIREMDEAFEWLEKAYEERDFELIALYVSPLYDNLRSDPRFTELLKKIGLDR